MKVTYTQNRFEIDGVPVINPEVFGFTIRRDYYYLPGMSVPMKEGYSFSIPENIIAEKIEQWEDHNGDIIEEKHTYDGWSNFIREVYRLKLKEPLVEVAGSIENRLRSRAKRESIETQDQLFDELREKVYKSQWFAGDLFNYLRANFTITRK